MSHERERFDRRELPLERERVVDVSPHAALLEIGRFGVADTRYYDPDLLKELRRLKAIKVKNDVASLTEDGCGAARHLCGGSLVIREQVQVKDSARQHDLEAHQAYCKERVEIEKAGGTVLAIRTEAEFVRDLGRVTGRSCNMRADVDDFARANDLSVIDGKLRIPDCRIGYELDGDIRHVDLEIASAHRGSQAVQAKKAAGMHVVDRNKTSRSQDRHDGMARLLR